MNFSVRFFENPANMDRDRLFFRAGAIVTTLASLTIYMDPPVFLMSLAVTLSPDRAGPGGGPSPGSEEIPLFLTGRQDNRYDRSVSLQATACGKRCACPEVRSFHRFC